jgi:hypothetical protein
MLRQEHRLRLSEKKFGPKSDEVTGDWRKLHNEELHNLYSSPNIIGMKRWAGHDVCMGAGKCIQIFGWET